MAVTRSPRFADNVQDGDLGELLALACPYCGHITPDHRWTPPGDCLVGTCECQGFLPGEGPDEIVMADGSIFTRADVPELEHAIRVARFQGSRHPREHRLALATRAGERATRRWRAWLRAMGRPSDDRERVELAKRLYQQASALHWALLDKPAPRITPVTDEQYGDPAILGRGLPG